MEKTTKYILIGLAVLVGVMIYMNSSDLLRTVFKSNVDSGIGGGSAPNINFLTVNLFDRNNNLISDSGANKRSVVNGHAGVASITVTVSLSNTGNQPYICTLSGPSPDFGSYLDITQAKSLGVNQFASWTSALIPVANFETAGSATFSLTATCTGSTGPTSKSGILTVTVTQEASGDFTLNVGSGGIGTEWCGDGTCQAVESINSCPGDCSAPPSTIVFRTNDPTYASGSGIAYTANAGSNLIAYGYVSKTTLMNGNCASGLNQCGAGSSIVMTAPSGWLGNLATATLMKPADASMLCVCDDSGTQYQIVKYSSSVASTVSTSKYSTNNPALEI